MVNDIKNTLLNAAHMLRDIAKDYRHKSRKLDEKAQRLEDEAKNIKPQL